MKRLMVLLVAAVFAVMGTAAGVMATPYMPNDIQIVQPDPSLPPTLVGFSGKWEGSFGGMEFFLIVEKINEETAILYLWSSRKGWERQEAKVAKAYGKWTIWFSGPSGKNEFSLRSKGKYLDLYAPIGTITFTRVP